MISRSRIAIATGGSLAVAAALLFSCGLDLHGERATVDPAEAGNESGTDGGVDGPHPEDGGTDSTIPIVGCPTDHGPMHLVETGGLRFCIDETEVTNAAYDTFLAAVNGGFDASLVETAEGGAAKCVGQTSVERQPAGTDSGAANYPVASITWCSAYAYCSWAGKRLCRGGTADGDAAAGEWYLACSNGGKNVYPYGDDFDAGACNVLGSAVGGAAAVGSFTGCVPSIAPVHDLSGNVDEWIDRCDALYCAATGGAYNSGAAQATCTSAFFLRPQLDPYAAIGFRCCADPN